MATKANSTKDEAVKDDTSSDDTAKGATPAGEQEVVSKDNPETEAPTSVEEVGEADVDSAGEVAGAVPYGVTGLEEDEVYTDWSDGEDFEGSLGTVSEGGYDVPWAYITPEDFEDSEVVRTADSDDGDVVAWNVQKTFEVEDEDEVQALVPVQATPGQTFTVDELPNVEVMQAAGINVAQFLSGLPVRPSYPDEPVRRGIPA